MRKVSLLFGAHNTETKQSVCECVCTHSSAYSNAAVQNRGTELCVIPLDEALVKQLPLWSVHDGVFLTGHLMQTGVPQPLDHTLHHAREQLAGSEHGQSADSVPHRLPDTRGITLLKHDNQNGVSSTLKISPTT